MNEAYQRWIRCRLADADGIAYGWCREWVDEMAAVFSELTRVRGHYYCAVWGEREHWWLVDPDGQVVDPTAEQFPSKGRGVYVPLDESLPEPTGMCPNCGEHCYDGGTCCSDECGTAYVAYCSNPMG